MKVERKILALVGCVLLQVGATTYGLTVPNATAFCSLIFLGSGIAISLLLLQLPTITKPAGKLHLQQRIIGAFAMLALIGVSFVLGGSVIRATQLTIEQADMLPIIEVMGKRFINGEWQTVYAPIPEIWNGVQPIYPPVMWGSFLPAVLLGFDLRWITLGAIVLAASLCLYPLLRVDNRRRFATIFLLAAVAILLAWLYTNHTHNVIRLTEEGVVYAWYCLLVYAVVSKKGWLIGLVATLCLFTRFALVGWLPVLALWWWMSGQRKLLWSAFATGIIALLVLIVPFGWKPLQVMLSLPAQYIAHAQKVWDEFPAHFTQSPGMAKFFGREGAATLHYTLLAASFLVPLLLAIYLLWKRKRHSFQNVPLALLILQLTVFYAFVDVSYLYLYYTPVFVSLLSASLVAGSKINPLQNE